MVVSRLVTRCPSHGNVVVFVRRSRLAASLCSVALVVAAGTSCASSGGSADTERATSSATPKPSTNGVEKLSPAKLLETASSNLEAQSAFRVRGNTTNGALDLVFVKGVGSTGTVTIGGHALTMLATGGKVWVKGDPAYYEAAVGPGSAQLIGDKWVELPAEATPKIAVFTDGATFLSNMINTTADTALTDIQDVDGSQAIGAQDPAGGGTLWVAANGPALPVRFDERGAAGDSGVLRFVDYGVAVPIAAPPSDQVAMVPPAPQAPPQPAPA
jgi:hypothetical protein